MISRGGARLVYALGGVVGLLAGLGVGAVVVGEPLPRACSSCRSDRAPTGPTLASPPVLLATTRPRAPAAARPDVALTHPAPRPAPPATTAGAQPAQEASAAAAPTTATATPTPSPTSAQAPPSGEPDPPASSSPTPPADPGDVSTSGDLISGLLTAGDPPPAVGEGSRE